MSHLSEKPVSQPAPRRTRDLILSVLDAQALPISTRELSEKLVKLGPKPSPADLKRNLDELLRLGHIMREHDPETGPHWTRVHGHKVPKHRPSQATTKLQRWALESLKHGPATAAMLASGARASGLVNQQLTPGQVAVLMGNILQPLAKSGDVLTSKYKDHGDPVNLYRLPGTPEPSAGRINRTPPPLRRPTELTPMQECILEMLQQSHPATASELVPGLIDQCLLNPGPRATQSVAAACYGLLRRRLIIETDIRVFSVASNRHVAQYGLTHAARVEAA